MLQPLCFMFITVLRLMWCIVTSNIYIKSVFRTFTDQIQNSKLWLKTKIILHHFHTIYLDVFSIVSPISVTEYYNSFRITVGFSLASSMGLVSQRLSPGGRPVLGQIYCSNTTVALQGWASRYIQWLGHFLCHRLEFFKRIGSDFCGMCLFGIQVTSGVHCLK